MRASFLKRILITGTCGFVGSQLARELKNEGHFIKEIDIK